MVEPDGIEPTTSTLPVFGTQYYPLLNKPFLILRSTHKVHVSEKLTHSGGSSIKHLKDEVNVIRKDNKD